MTIRYRYTLRRETGLLSGAHRGLFVMLNPSTADDATDDATIRRCRAFACRELWRCCDVVNLFAARATNPSDLWRALRDGGDIVGALNDEIIRAQIGATDVHVAAWGAVPKSARQRVVDVVGSVAPGVAWRCLGQTRDGNPRHPLYVRGDQPLVTWDPFLARNT